MILNLSANVHSAQFENVVDQVFIQLLTDYPKLFGTIMV